MRGRRRLDNAALILPLFGAVLIVPPVIGVFSQSVLVGGIPLAAVYLFAVWAALIGLTASLGRRLQTGRTADPDEETRGAPVDR